MTHQVEQGTFVFGPVRVVVGALSILHVVQPLPVVNGAGYKSRNSNITLSSILNTNDIWHLYILCPWVQSMKIVRVASLSLPSLCTRLFATSTEIYKIK